MNFNTFFRRIIGLFAAEDELLMGREIKEWRQEVCDTVFKFFAILAFFTYIPSVYLSIKEHYYLIAFADTLFYLSFLILARIKNLNYKIKNSIGLAIFFFLGLVVLIVLGPLGAGEIWMFSTTILAAFLLGNKGAIASFLIYTITNITVWILLDSGNLDWESKFNILPDAWLVKSLNYILLNMSIVVSNALFLKGFQNLIKRIVQTRNASMIGLAKLAEYRDNDTGQHLIRLQNYIELLTDDLRISGKYHGYITKEYIRDLKNSIILHDIGKVGIQDSILLKPDKLDKEEYDIIKSHPVIGGAVISAIEKNISGQSLYSLGKEIALYHHERWDGLGYPEGLKGDRIPLSARITALVDVYDALVSERPYKKAFKHEDAVELISEQRGKQFDPDIVDSFMNVSEQIFRISISHSDTE